MRLKEITPTEFMCTAMACPAVYVTENEDELAIIGRKVDNLEELGIAKRVGEDEQVVMVDKGMLRQLFEQHSQT